MSLDRIYVADVLAACRDIESFVAGLDKKSFSESRMAQCAVVCQLGVIGEAVQRLSPAFRDSRPQIDWRAIRAMRNLLVHHYGGIDYDRVYEAAVDDVPVLRATLESQACDESRE